LSEPGSSKGQRIASCFRKANLIGANSNFTAGMVSRFVKDASRVRVLWPGVHFPAGVHTASTPELDPKRSPRLLTIARLDPYKGIDTTLRSLPLILARHPNLIYDVVGAGQDLERLIRLTNGLHIQPHVRFHGSVPEPAKANLLRTCDVFLLPNRGEPGEVEGFGMVLAEAAAFAKPAIAGRNGGTADVIAADTTGFLVDGTDPSELATAVTRLLDHPHLAHRMGIAAQERFRTQFAWEVAVKRFEAALYE
jgi:phosphatidylinositol alpha-1,6-mannosyltransferase